MLPSIAVGWTKQTNGESVARPEVSRPRISRRQASAEESRRKLLAAALAHFSRQSYDEVTAADITETAGVAAGLLFHHFGNKRGIYLEALTEATRQLEASHDTDPAAAPGVQVRQLLRRHLTYMLGNPELALNIILTRATVAHEDPDPFERNRWETISWACDVLGLDPEHPALRLMWRTFGGASDQLTVTLLGAPSPHPVDAVVEALIEILVGCLQGAVSLAPDLSVAGAVAELRRHRPA